MANDIDEAYLARLTAFEFPDMPVEPAAAPTAGAGRGSYAGFDPDEDARAKEPQASMTEYDPTVRQRLSTFLQRGFEGMGVDQASARRNAQSIIGGESSNLPLSMGLADLVPFLGTGLQIDESVRMGEDAAASFERGDYGTAALQAGGSALGLVPGAVSTVAAAKPIIGEAAKQLDRAMMEGTGPLAAVVPDAVRPMNVVEPGLGIPPAPPTRPPSVTATEKQSIISAAGDSKKNQSAAIDEARRVKGNFPKADGWVPIEITGGKLDEKTKKFKVEAKKIPYNFHVPPGKMSKGQWQSNMTTKLVNEVDAVVQRAAAGDQAAIEILNQANWYRSMRTRLRAEFGGIGDVFADVLGTTSAQTGVEQNFDNAVEILRRFSRGEYNNELAAFERRVASGKPIDGKTLTQMHKSGEFPLITKAGGQLFNANSPASMGALLDMFRAVKASDSPKTPNFTGNLIGLTNEATIDVWAARMLRRIADLPRIPPLAEKGVAGKHLVGSTLYDPKVGSEFGFGQDAFREAAKQINSAGTIKGVAPQLGDLGPDDLQAVAWFIEKEKWTQNGWTSKAGEGGSLDYEMSFAGASDPQAVKELRREINVGFKEPPQRKTETDAEYAQRVQQARSEFDQAREAKKQELAGMKSDVERYTLGVSGERPGKPMTDYGQAELAAEFDDVVRDDANVLTYNLANTYGSFMGDTERAINAEFVVRPDFSPKALEQRLVEQGKAYDQDAVFMSKVAPDGAAANSRPGVEIYFKQKVTPEQMAKITERLRQYGVDGFTYVTDMRFSDKVEVQARAGNLAETAGLNGVRFQYIPEFDDAYNANNRAQIMAEKQRLFDKVVADTIADGNVSDARLVWYDTKVYFRGDYDAYLGTTTGRANPKSGARPPSSADAAQPDSSGQVGKDFSRAVSNRLSKKAAGAAPAKVGANPRAKGLLDGY
jgi:hypothetical protein